MIKQNNHSNIDFADRFKDLKNRGKDTLVHDFNGKKVKLINAEIWYNNDGNYVEPKLYSENNTHENSDDVCFINLYKLINKLFCIKYY